MSDDDLTSAHELASGYLDDELDASSRAQVEASPELMALVDEFRRTRTAIAAAVPVSAQARDAALAAALAEFDVLHAASGVPAAPSNVVALDSRRRFMRLVTGVAAAVVLVGVGIVAVGGLRGNSAQESTSKGAPTADASVTVAGGGAPVSTIGAITGPAQAVPTLSDPQQLLAVATQPGIGANDPNVATAGSVVPPSDSSAGVPEGTTGGSTAGNTAGGSETFVTRVAQRCPLAEHQQFVAEIVWKSTPAMVVRDTVTGVVQAIDDQCTVLAEATP